MVGLIGHVIPTHKLLDIGFSLSVREGRAVEEIKYQFIDIVVDLNL